MARGRDSAYLDILGGIPLFDGLTKKQLRFIARMASEMPLRAGSTLVKQGEPGQEGDEPGEGQQDQCTPDQLVPEGGAEEESAIDRGTREIVTEPPHL